MHTRVDERHEVESQPPRRRQLAEVLIFLFLVVPIVIVIVSSVSPAELDFTSVVMITLVQNLLLVGVVLYLLRRNGESLRTIGLRFEGAGRDVVLGLLLFLPFTIALGLLERLLNSLGLSSPETYPAFLVPQGMSEYALALLFLVVVAVAEEVVFRGYLIRRFMGLTGSALASVLLAALIFSFGHGYEGSAGVVAVGVIGIVFGIIYLWRGSLVTPMVMHFLQNFVAIVVVPFMAVE